SAIASSVAAQSRDAGAGLCVRREAPIGDNRVVGADELLEAAERPWLEEGRIDEGRRTLAELLDRAGEDAPAASRARALTTAGVLAFRAGDTDAATSAHLQALELARVAGDREAEARAHGGLARVALRAGDFNDTRRHAEAAVARAPAPPAPLHRLHAGKRRRRTRRFRGEPRARAAVRRGVPGRRRAHEPRQRRDARRQPRPRAVALPR